MNTDYYQINKSYKFIHLLRFCQKFYIMISACMGLNETVCIQNTNISVLLCNFLIWGGREGGDGGGGGQVRSYKSCRLDTNLKRMSTFCVHSSYRSHLHK